LEITVNKNDYFVGYGKIVSNLDIGPSGLEVEFVGSDKKHLIPFGAFSWVSPDWFEGDIVKGRKLYATRA
jgi:hypothetical protein